jgi:predicted metal-dependent HD superfamily phosphohydrolase
MSYAVRTGRRVTCRVEVLRGFLARPKVFHFDTFVEWYEERARENLAAAIRVLTG